MNTAALSLQPETPHSRRAIADHFFGRISLAREAAMRAHLPTCTSCRHHYDRHLVLARLDPHALPAAQRIAGGLGLRFPVIGGRGRAPGRLGVALLVPAVAAAAFVFLTREHRDPSGDVDPAAAFAARGAPRTNTPEPSFWTYRLGTNGTPVLADRTLGASDEVAFAYSNPEAKPYILIFGVDEHRHVYWFHPAWPTGQPAPVAIPAAAGPGPHELPDAIRHAFDGRRLTLYATFADSAVAATTVETAVRTATDADTLPPLGEGIVMTRRVFEVRP